MKNILLLAVVMTSAACAGREIRRPIGCDDRLSNPEKRAACRACVERPRPHVYLPDRPEGDRCVPR